MKCLENFFSVDESRSTIFFLSIEMLYLSLTSITSSDMNSFNKSSFVSSDMPGLALLLYVGENVIVNKSNPVNLTDEKTVSKRHMTDKTYAEVVAQKEFRETEVLPFESTIKKESTERVKE